MNASDYDVTRFADKLLQRMSEDHSFAARVIGALSRVYLENKATHAIDSVLDKVDGSHVRKKGLA